MSNTLVFHAAGGCGINISDDVFSKLKDLGDGYADTRFHYVDTSRANIDKIKPLGDFFQITTKTNSLDQIQGTGADRKRFIHDVIPGVKEYLDKNKYLSLKRDEFHIVAFSTSGGSGSTIGPLIVKDLISRDIPVIALVVGDSSNGINCMNTVRTIDTLDAIAKQAKRCLSVIYFNNHSLLTTKKDSVHNLNNAEQEVNKIILSTMTLVSVFLSGDNEALDNQDMANIIDQSKYTNIEIQPGLYGLTLFMNNIATQVEGAIPTVGRSLTVKGENFDTNLTLLHHKRGYIEHTNVIEKIQKDNLPMHMISYANYLLVEKKNLETIEQNYNNILNSLQESQKLDDHKYNVDEETGLVL